MSGALDPIQEDLPLDLTQSPAKLPAPRRPVRQPGGDLPPSLVEQVLARLRAIPWARIRSMVRSARWGEWPLISAWT